jgi:multiple antibiotic resistance protein
LPILSIALAFFLITNPIGNTPCILALLKGIDPARQRRILFRETLIATTIAVTFLFAGEGFLATLGIKGYTVSLCGGILLIIVALQMIYPKHVEPSELIVSQREPFVVPIATPLLSGGGLLTTILLYANREGSLIRVLIALLISFSAVLAVMLAAPSLNRLMGKRGLLALEQLMGMVLSFLATEILINGIRAFIQSLTGVAT